MYLVGVDIGGTSIKFGVMDEDGTLYDKWSIPTDKTDDGAYVLPEVAASILEKLTEKKISPKEVKGIGVGVPGPVDHVGLVQRCVNIGWGVMDVKIVGGPNRHSGKNGKRRQCGCFGRSVERKRPRVSKLGDGDHWHWGGRWSDFSWKDIFWNSWHCWRTGAYYSQSKGDNCLQLRQIWLSRTICFGYRAVSYGP